MWGIHYFSSNALLRCLWGYVTLHFLSFPGLTARGSDSQCKKKLKIKTKNPAPFFSLAQIIVRILVTNMFFSILIIPVHSLKIALVLQVREKQVHVKYAEILMQIEHLVLSCPDCISTNLRRTQLCPPYCHERLQMATSQGTIRARQNNVFLSEFLGVPTWQVASWLSTENGATHSLVLCSSSVSGVASTDGELCVHLLNCCPTLWI